ncbi:MAG: pyridoxal phosphate-dependent aminotransferase [Elusimicrobia bacterium]|nr:pyridoxal phosphate-dependent aminotransferase [Elusimicrobiota bacterium]
MPDNKITEKFHPSFTKLGLSSIVAISEQVRDLEAATGRKIIPFQRGDLNLEAPEYVKDAAKKAIDANRTRYPRSGGEPGFKEAVVKYHKESGVELVPENIVCLHGGQEGLQLSFSLFRGKRVLGFSPYWPCLTGNIFPYSENAFETVPLEEKNGKLSFDPAELKRKLKDADLLYVNTPHNPTGKVFDRAELRLIDEAARKAGVVIVSDEPYDKIVYDGREHISMLEFGNENTIVVFSASKSYAVTGFRAGYAVSRNTEIAALLTRANYSQTAGVATPIQDACAAALNDRARREEWVAFLKDTMQRRRDALYTGLAEVFPGLVKPQGAFYYFLDMRGIIPPAVKNRDEYLLNLFLDSDVAIVPGASFGKEGFIRVSFSGTGLEETAEGARRIVRAVKKAKADGAARTALAGRVSL